MVEQGLDYYMEHSDEFESLSEDEKAQVYAGAESKGDTGSEADNNSETPDADLVKEDRNEPEAEGEQGDGKTDKSDEAKPTVIAKDGEHTIPYEQLQEARNAAKRWEQIATEAMQKLEAAANEADVDPQKASADIRDLIKQSSEAWIDSDFEKFEELQVQIHEEMQRSATSVAEARVEKMLQEERARTESASEQMLFQSEVAKAQAAHPFLDVASPEGNPLAIELVVAQRDKLIAEGLSPSEALKNAVGKVAPLFQPKEETTKPTQPQADAAKLAADAIAKAKPKAPTSLSEVPAGSSAPHDEAAAMREMSGVKLLNKFGGMSQEKIMELMSRVI